MKLILLSGAYGVGKSTLASSLAGSNVVSIASPLRRLLLKCFRGAEALHSRKAKTSTFDKKELKSFLKKERVRGVEKRLFLTFQTNLASLDSLDDLTGRDLLKLFGDSGREVCKNYWVSLCVKDILDQKAPILCVDDLRYMNELAYLRKWAKKRFYECTHIHIGEALEEHGYDLTELYEVSDYKLTLDHLG